MIVAIMAPIKTEINITIARDAWKFQNKKEIVTGAAFWSEKAATSAIIIKAKINKPKITPFDIILLKTC